MSDRAERPGTAARGTTATPSCRPMYQGTAAGSGRRHRPADAVIRNLAGANSRAADQAEALRPAHAELNAEQLKNRPGDSELEAVAKSYRVGVADAGRTPRTCSTCPKKRPETLKPCTASGTSTTDTFGRRVPHGPPAVRVGGALHPGDATATTRQPGVGPALEHAEARTTRRRGQADRRAAHRPEAARPARRTRSCGGAASSGGRRTPRIQRHRPRPQPGGFTVVAGRRRT